MRILSYQEETKSIEQVINALGDGLNILEAGCGRRWPLELSVSYRLVGVDPDEEALRARVTEKEDLEDYQVSTINDATFTEHSFDVIYCAYVLEHVLGVRRVLENFAQWIKPGGIIVLRIPDSRSVYAFIARYTSHWFHVLVKRHIYKHKNAGKLGYGPYPIVYEPEMSLAGIERFCNQRGFSMSVTANARYLSRASWIAPFTALVSALSFGVLRWRYSDLAIVIRA